MDCSDNVIVINADKVQLTGNKRQENYYWHTGYQVGLNHAPRKTYWRVNTLKGFNFGSEADAAK